MKIKVFNFTFVFFILLSILSCSSYDGNRKIAQADSATIANPIINGGEVGNPIRPAPSISGMFQSSMEKVFHSLPSKEDFPIALKCKLDNLNTMGVKFAEIILENENQAKLIYAHKQRTIKDSNIGEIKNATIEKIEFAYDSQTQGNGKIVKFDLNQEGNYIHFAWEWHVKKRFNITIFPLSDGLSTLKAGTVNKNRDVHESLEGYCTYLPSIKTLPF